MIQQWLVPVFLFTVKLSADIYDLPLRHIAPPPADAATVYEQVRTTTEGGG